ncbi:hypothetical protein EAG_12131 [Camponotus floridanus]|uniref:Uncharacterized protein n=1 Tax=Camponotus floridanus TaxID=104421 RepID=E2B0G5_CAMFO|nr:hypothetical protein EAG_12131 [Camponotus floridanus]
MEQPRANGFVKSYIKYKYKMYLWDKKRIIGARSRGRNEIKEQKDKERNAVARKDSAAALTKDITALSYVTLKTVLRILITNSKNARTPGRPLKRRETSSNHTKSSRTSINRFTILLDSVALMMRRVSTTGLKHPDYYRIAVSDRSQPLCPHKRTPHRSRARISAMIPVTSSFTPKPGRISAIGDDKLKAIPERRPATFDGRRRTGERQPAASGWEQDYLIDAGVLDADARRVAGFVCAPDSTVSLKRCKRYLLNALGRGKVGRKCHYCDESEKHPAPSPSSSPSSSPMRRASERILETNGHGRSEIRKPISRRVPLSQPAKFHPRAFHLPRIDANVTAVTDKI